MKSLTEIANLNLTDKGTIGPRKGVPANFYTDVYTAYFEPLRDRPLNLLEIGLGVTGEHWKAQVVTAQNPGGASVRTWQDYFPKAQIYGIDINECRWLDTDRIHTYQVDQGDPKQLDAFLAQCDADAFDIIIDDGSHWAHHQQISFSVLFKALKPGGLYIIEDLSGNDEHPLSGSGDGTTVNTRYLFRTFKHTGTFPEPNRLTQPQALAQDIAFIAFHSLRPGFQLHPEASLRRPLRKVPTYAVGRERMCVICKR